MSSPSSSSERKLQYWSPLDKINKYYYYIHKYPVYWSPKKIKLECHIHDPWTMIPWIFVIVVLSMGLGSATSFYLCLRQLLTGVKRHSLVDLFMLLSTGIWVQILAICGFVVARYAEEFVFGFNACLALEGNLRRETQHLFPHGAKEDKTASIMNFVIQQQCILPYMFVTGVVYKNKEPSFHILCLFLPMSIVKSIPMTIARVAVNLISVLEITRGMSMLTMWVLIIFKSILNSLHYLQLRSTPKEFHRHVISNVKIYRRIQIANQCLSMVTGTLGFLGMSCATMFTVTCSFVTIRMYGAIPHQMYFPIGPIGLVINAIIFLLMGPVVAEVSSMTEQLHKTWRMNLMILTPNWRKYYLKLLTSVGRPLSIQVSLFSINLFSFQRKTKATYFEVNAQYAISALMTYDSL